MPEYDVLVWGATAFTGRLACKHLAEHGGKLKWAVAGRREAALVEIKDSLSAKPCPPVAVEVGEATDEVAAARMAARSKCVLAMAGPYVKYSAAILKACARNGTHYVDITGEAVPFVSDSVQTLHEAAVASGAKIVHFAGYDSVPSDLLSLLAVRELQALGQTCDHCTVACDLRQTIGGMSAGTLHTMCELTAHFQSHPADIPIALDPLCLAPPAQAKAGGCGGGRGGHPLYNLLTGGDAWHLPGWSELLDTWHCLFVMSFPNSRCVRRSRALLGDVPAHFVYREVMACGADLLGGVLALVITCCFSLSALMLLPPVRWLVKKVMPIGTGPPEVLMRNSHWRFTVAAVGDHGAVATGSVVATGQDPGCTSTSMMAAQTALCLLDIAAAEANPQNKNPKDLDLASVWNGGGVLTPASACGTHLVRRFAQHRVVFDVKAHRVPPGGRRSLLSRLVPVALAWWLTTTVAFIRAPELIAVCRDAAIALHGMVVGAVPATAASLFPTVGTLAALLMLLGMAALLRLPLLASRSAKGYAVPAAALASYAVLVGLCDGPLLWRPSTGLHSLAGKTVLVTGANAGIGLAASKTLAEHDAHVLLACRSATRCTAAAAEIRAHARLHASSGGASAIDAPLDLSDLRSVEAFARAVARRHTRIDILVLNAGFAGGRNDGRAPHTAQGLELSLGSMHVGHALLAKKLMPLLKKRPPPSAPIPAADPARIITVASEASHLAIPFPASFYTKDGEGDLRGEATHVSAPLGTPSYALNLMLDELPHHVFSSLGLVGFAPTYMRAKYANVLFSRALAEERVASRALGQRRVLSTAVGPGFVRSSIFSQTGVAGLGSLGIEALAVSVMRSARLGSIGVVRAAVDTPASVDAKFIDSMAVPRAFDDSCWATGGCTSADAHRLARVTKRLMQHTQPVRAQTRTAPRGIRPPVAVSEPPLPSLTLLLGGASLLAAAFAPLVALRIRRRRMDRLRGRPPSAVAAPPPSPPSAWLQSLNTFLQVPTIAAIASGLYWSAVALLAGILAPVVALHGVGATAAEVLRDADASEPDESERADLAVVITGCDSGFGRGLALHLAHKGYTVFAGCLSPSTAAPFPSAPRLQIRALQMDVTSDGDVHAARAAVNVWLGASNRRRLLCVVANAGVGHAGFAEWAPMSSFEQDIAVNYLGAVRVSKAFIPALRQSARFLQRSAAAGSPRSRAAPRVVIVSSMSGKLPMPLLSPYSSSKHAAAAFGASLRMELRMWGIDVCTCLPSFHKTPLLDHVHPKLDAVWSQVPAEVQSEYGAAGFASVKRCGDQLFTSWAWDAERVVEGLVRAATSTAPPPAELVIGSDAHFGLQLMRHLPPALYEAVIYYYILWDLVEPQ